MREIKFRAWDKVMKRWHYNPMSFSFRETEIYTHLDFNQYTGLKDMNDKEIYEGDIVNLKITYWNNCNKEYVEYEREFTGEITDFRWLGWSVRYKEKDNNGDYPLMWLLGQDYTIEVKGNIYDNPELLDN